MHPGGEVPYNNSMTNKRGAVAATKMFGAFGKPRPVKSEEQQNERQGVFLLLFFIGRCHGFHA
mgnify:CR=1 FL=1